ncbi:MAG TPA: septum formation family protein [Micromonosporaceae bacterium]|nr:septum formation family protein [Micromonosporaceae bacterium]
MSAIMAVVALRQVSKGGRGKGLAMAALVVSAAWMLVLATAVLSGEKGASGSVGSLRPGDCVNGLRDSGTLLSLPIVSCTEPHEGEVFAIITLAGDDWPGAQAAAEAAQSQCAESFLGYAPTAANDARLALYFLHPTERSWGQGNHSATCIATDPAGKRSGSVRG